MIKDSLHAKLKQQIVSVIDSSTVNTRLPSIRKLAQDYGVSRGTVEKVIRELHMEGYVKCQTGKGTYIIPRDGVSDAGSPNGSKTIILASPDFFSYFIWRLVHATEIAAHKKNIRLIYVRLQAMTDYDTICDIIEKNPQVKGAMIFPAGIIGRDVLRKLDKYGKPIVMLSMLNSNGLKNIYQVSVDNFRIGYLKAQSLLEKGHKLIGYIMNEPDKTSIKEQQRGIITAFDDYGVKRKYLLKSGRNVVHWEYTSKEAIRMTREMMTCKKPPTALITDSIPGGFGALRALNELNIKSPEQVSLVTGNEHAGFEEVTSPALTTVTHDFESHVNVALQIIMDDKKQHTKVTLLEPKLIERESVRSLE